MFAPAAKLPHLSALCAGAALVGSCSPPPLDIGVCQKAGTVAFWIAYTPGWLLPRVPRPSSIAVFEEGHGPVWDIDAPRATIADWFYDPHRQARPLAQYGDTLAGWKINSPLRPLKVGLRYDVSITANRRYGTTQFVMGQPLPPCPTGAWPVMH